MSRVAVRVLHAEAPADAGPLVRGLAAVRERLAASLVDRFRSAGADDAEVVAGPGDDTPFGRRLRRVVETARPGGLVVAGSGALVRARASDLRQLIATAASGEPVALANNRYSADVVAVSCAERLLDVPDLEADNGLPRWLAEVAGYRIADLARRRRLQLDVDGPLDALLLRVPWPNPVDLEPADAALRSVAGVASERRSELVLAGRTSARTLGWLERHTAARVRALVEERGMRSAAGANVRPPASVLGLLLDAAGADQLGALLARLGDAAVVDTRVLLAHRLGPDERSWPAPEDRFASDLLLSDRVSDPWLRSLTQAAAAAPIPIVLGGHTLVGPGLPLALGRRRP